MKSLCIVISLSILLSISKYAFSKEPWQDAVSHKKPFDPMAAALLVPPFCEGGSGIGIIHQPKNWKKIYGQDVMVLNHYCDGKHRIPICYQYPEKEMKACLTYFLEGTTYAINLIKDPNFSLLPFIYSERGNLNKDIGNYEEAISDFKASIQKNKNFVPAFLGIADTFIKIKNYEEAEKYIQMGLEHNPNKKSLKKKLNKIKNIK